MNKSCETCRFNVEREFDMKRCKACSRTDRAYYEPYVEQAQQTAAPTAADLMEKFIEEGLYGQMKAAEDRKKNLKSWLRMKLEHSEQKRHEFKEFNRVAKFVSKNIYEWDYEGLNDCLDSYGLLPLVASLDNTKIKNEPDVLERVAPFVLPTTYYIKPTLNKVGREFIARAQAELSPSEGESIERVLADLVQTERRLAHIQMAYEQEKAKMLRCPKLNENRKLSHKYGSISLVANAPKYDMQKLYLAEGADFLIKYTKPDMEKLNSFIERKLFPKEELEKFRTIVDIKLDFVVMSLSDEKRLMQQFQERKIRRAMQRIS
jgi:DNA-binding Lrp family transcriptional regulator